MKNGWLLLDKERLRWFLHSNEKFWGSLIADMSQVLVYLIYTLWILLTPGFQPCMKQVVFFCHLVRTIIMVCFAQIELKGQIMRLFNKNLVVCKTVAVFIEEKVLFWRRSRCGLASCVRTYRVPWLFHDWKLQNSSANIKVKSHHKEVLFTNLVLDA